MQSLDINLLIKSIIEKQSTIIGPLAIEQANKVVGVKVSADMGSIQVDGDPRQVLNNLVIQYEKIFGLASVEVCKDAVREVQPTVPQKELPEILQ